MVGKIAFVEWTDDDTVRRCGSAARGDRLAAAGASGFIYADDEESFAAGITGAVAIPGVLAAKSGGDAIRSELAAGHPVTIGGTTPNGFNQLDSSGRDDLVAAFSSRGIGDSDNVKPDVTAVGETVFSTGVGTGNGGAERQRYVDGRPDGGRHCGAGEVAARRTGDPEQVKADIMNTADQDLLHRPRPHGTRSTRPSGSALVGST